MDKRYWSFRMIFNKLWSCWVGVGGFLIIGWNVYYFIFVECGKGFFGYFCDEFCFFGFFGFKCGGKCFLNCIKEECDYISGCLIYIKYIINEIYIGI